MFVIDEQKKSHFDMSDAKKTEKRCFTLNESVKFVNKSQ